jgi:hypothetical protein
MTQAVDRILTGDPANIRILPADKPAIMLAVIDAIRLGHSFEGASAIARVSSRAMQDWRRDDADFAAKVSAARFEALAKRERRIDKAGEEGDWRADAWKAERMHPDIYGRAAMVDQRQVTVNLVLPESIDAATLEALRDSLLSLKEST